MNVLNANRMGQTLAVAGACGLALGLVHYLIGPTLSGWGLCALASILIGSLLRLQRMDQTLRLFGQVMSTTQSILIASDLDGRVSLFNVAAERALGYSAREVIGRLRLEDFHARGPWGAVAAEGSEASEATYMRKDGTTFPALTTIGELKDHAGRVMGRYEIALDISARKIAEEKLREQRELIESVAATSPTIFFTYSLSDHKIVYANRQLPAALGYGEADAQRMGDDPIPSMIHPEDLDILHNRYQTCATLKDGQVLESEFRCLTAHGGLRWLTVRDVVFKRDAEGRPTQILCNILDITERKVLDEQVQSQVLEIQDTNLALEIQTSALEEANSQLEALAFTDGLTGIANHRSFQETLADTFQSSRRKRRMLSLMLIDVDRFKQYNDTFGHLSGDIVLKRVAKILRDCCPERCTAARYGGEEFAVLCPGFTPEEVLDLGETIRATIENAPWPERSVTVSVGAVSLCAATTTPADLVAGADSALYSSKASGRNCVTLYDLDQGRRLAS